MPSKKKISLILIGLAVLALAYVYFSLPRITANLLVSQAEKLGLKNLQFKMIHIGWQRLELAEVTLGDAAAPSLRIPRLSVDYSLAGLWRKRIKHVRLAGVRIRIEDRGQGFHFPGMITPEPAPNGEMPTIERISLEDAVVRLAWAGRSLDIPVNATLRASGAGYDFSAVLRPLAAMVRVRGTVDSNAMTGKIAFTVPGFPLPALIEQAGFGSVVSGRGRIAAQGEIILFRAG